jgi:hypothetical protein
VAISESRKYDTPSELTTAIEKMIPLGDLLGMRLKLNRFTAAAKNALALASLLKPSTRLAGMVAPYATNMTKTAHPK